MRKVQKKHKDNKDIALKDTMKEMVDSNPSRSRLKKKYNDFFTAGGSPDLFDTARKVYKGNKAIALKETMKEMVNSIPAGTGRTSRRSGRRTSCLPACPTAILWASLYGAFVRYMLAKPPITILGP